MGAYAAATLDAVGRTTGSEKGRYSAVIPQDRARTPQTDISVMTVDGVTVVSVTGVVDMLTAPDLHVSVRDVLADEPAAVLIDLGGVDFLASAGLEVLVNAHRLAGTATRLAVVAHGPATARPIQLTGVDDYVPLYATANEALAALIAG